MGVFPNFRTPKIFFKNRALSLLYPYDALTSCKKLEKTQEQSLRYLKTDRRTDKQTRAITKDPLKQTDKGNYQGPPRVNPGSNMIENLSVLQTLLLNKF